MTEPTAGNPQIGSPLSLAQEDVIASQAAAVAAGESPGEELFSSGLELKARSQWWYARNRFIRHRLAITGLFILVVVFVAGAFAPHVAPYAYDKFDFTSVYASPSWHHLFGTDQFGRDYFSRTLYGIRTTERVALTVALLGTFIGILVGSFAGYFGRWLDNLLMRFTDLVLVCPILAVLLVAAKYFGHGSPTRVAVILGVLLWPNIARIVRGSFLSLKEKEYVDAARAAGSGDLRIMFRHILPNIIGPIAVAATLLTGAAILTEATLSFLGFGVQAPNASLGELINDGQNEGLNYWWLVTMPGLVIVLIIMCFNFIGDGLRDALDPTQRRVRH